MELKYNPLTSNTIKYDQMQHYLFTIGKHPHMQLYICYILLMEFVGLIAFLFFSTISLFVSSERHRIQKRNFSDWITDVSSILVHFLVIPSLQITVVHGIMNWTFPNLKGSVSASIWFSFLIYVLLDYLWYWNHRILHAKTPLWNLHKTHHSPEHLDVFVTPRNALITHFVMIYFWFIGAATYLLNDPTAFLAFATFGVVINFWGHTSFSLPCNHWINKLVSVVLITPREHLWHHSRANPDCNFGTVFIFWDKIHGTAFCKDEHPDSFGDSHKKTVWNQLIWPF